MTWKEEQKGGVIIVHEIGRRTTKRVEDEVEKTKNASIEAEIAAERKAKAEINARRKTKKAWFKEVNLYLKAGPRLSISFTLGG